jgi:c-di-GMP-binding flagellar brake protein YcgR
VSSPRRYGSYRMAVLLQPGLKGLICTMEKLPLEIGSVIFVQSMENKAVKAKSTVIGARHGDFVIIEDPVVHFSDRLFSKLTGDIQCQYLYEGDLYEFTSKVRYYGKEAYAVIDYPAQFRQTQLRKHHRIRVNIETKIKVQKERDMITGVMTDISSGGCQLTIPSMLLLAKGTECSLSFVLPDNTHIESVSGVIRSIKLDKRSNSSEIGLQFIQDQEQLDKIISFCRFCMFFEA